MRYGILTYHHIPNYGAVLQAYALCAAIRKLGYDCEIIDYQCENIVKRELSIPQYSNPIKRAAYQCFIWPHQKRKTKECVDFLQKFYSRQHYTKDTIGEADRQYDVFISGSDMIWNLDVNGGDMSYFLDFVGAPHKRLSFASSVGDVWSEEQCSKIEEALKHYQWISVREFDTCEKIRNQFGLPCEVVCDPTMLLEASEWSKFTFSVPENNYVLVYFPYDEILTTARKYAKKEGKKLIILGTTYPWKSNDYKTIYSPQEWMSYIKYADAVFTDSYHGLLFSLYFNRPVWTNNRNNRLAMLLKELEIEKCYIEEDPLFQHTINYEICNKKIWKKRTASIKFLQKELGETKSNAR